jgi:nitrate reductase NapAB chaperone NapD
MSLSYDDKESTTPQLGPSQSKGVVFQLMAICSYVVFPQQGRAREVFRRLSRIRNCEVVPAENRSLMILLTDTETVADEQALQQQLNSIEDIECMALTFGEVDPETGVADPQRAVQTSRLDQPDAE